MKQAWKTATHVITYTASASSSFPEKPRIFHKVDRVPVSEERMKFLSALHEADQVEGFWELAGYFSGGGMVVEDFPAKEHVFFHAWSNKFSGAKKWLGVGTSLVDMTHAG
jgi:hypothetical protein